MTEYSEALTGPHQQATNSTAPPRGSEKSRSEPAGTSDHAERQPKDPQTCPEQLADIVAAATSLVLELLTDQAARTATLQRVLSLQLDMLKALQRSNLQLPVRTCRMLLDPSSPLVALRCAAEP